MKKFTLLILAAIILLSSCSDKSKTENLSTTEEESNTQLVTATPPPEPTSAPTPEPTAEPEVFDVNSISARSLNALIKKQSIPDDTTQLVLVAVGQAYDKMYLMEKQESEMWQVVYGPFDVQIGKEGLGKEKEGDGKSPEGIYELGYAFGRGNAPTDTIWPWRSTMLGDIWIEDSNSKYYNMYVKDGSVEDADWKNYSNLNIAAFDRAIEIRYNTERESGAGSAIFLHIWVNSKRDTNGCTAISRENIETLITWLDPSANTMIAQLPHELIGYGDLVYLSDFTTEIIADIKFAEDENIFGVKLEGYNDNQVITKVDLAKALVSANEMLKGYETKLIVYDAYRPMTAFYQIEDWLKDAEDISTKETYYKDKTKEELRDEYLSYYSNRLYTRSQVVHVALASLNGEPLDMGSNYMVFDEYASYVCDDLSQQQIYNRELLHDIMIQSGFESVDNQWWKFQYNPYLYATKYDEIIE